MYPVTHVTIAVGAVKAGERLFPARWLPLDYRFAALGALLPDLIDKPLKWFLIPSLPDDHLWGHTVWLSAVLIGVGLLFALRRSDSRVLLVGIGALTHLIFDPVATDARTLFWPLFGSTFHHPRGYWFESPVPGPVIDVMLITALLILPQAFEPFRRRISAFATSGTV
jgi:hypothetical protein